MHNQSSAPIGALHDGNELCERNSKNETDLKENREKELLLELI